MRKTIKFHCECNFPKCRGVLVGTSFGCLRFLRPNMMRRVKTGQRECAKSYKNIFKGYKCCAFIATEIWPFSLTCSITLWSEFWEWCYVLFLHFQKEFSSESFVNYKYGSKIVSVFLLQDVKLRLKVLRRCSFTQLEVRILK